MVNKLQINPKTIEIEELLARNFIIITSRTKINKTFDEAMKQFGVFIVPAPTVTRDSDNFQLEYRRCTPRNILDVHVVV